jgi:glycosyltransferase involved in cell wall biosynthesis
MHSPKNTNVVISVIISTYNRSQHLSNCLESFCKLDKPKLSQIEFIVCDDGSTDNTFNVIKAFEHKLYVRYCYQPHQDYRLAASRNMAIKLSIGKFLLFIDSDAIAAPDLVEKHLYSHILIDKQAVVIGAIHGYRAKTEKIQEFLNSKDGNWREDIESDSTMADRRISLWASLNFEAEKLVEPWTMLMGNNFSVSREAILMAGMFDEEFVGWGGEDTDLAYRLHQLNIPFCINKDAAIIHQPHPKETFRSETYLVNKRRIYKKFPNLITELIPYFDVLTYETSINELKRLISQSLVPSYMELWSKSFKDRIQKMVTGPSYLMGGGSEVWLAEFLKCICISDPDQRKLEHASYKYPWLLTRNCLGVDSNIDVGVVETTIITDFWRAFSEKIVLGLISEAVRISKRVFLLHTPEFSVPYASFTPNWSLANLSSLLQSGLLQTIPMKLEERSNEEITKVYEVRVIERL